MGTYLTRTRAWCYIAFYDEYVGRHINTSIGASMLFMMPFYLYGIHLNRQNEETFNHYMYNWQFWDKRNRLTHNMIMEHFEVHKEELEDLIVDMKKEGPKVFMDLESGENTIKKNRKMDLNDFALIDEISGLNTFLNGYMTTQNLPEQVKDRIRARMFTYNSAKPKEVALNEMKNSIFGT